MMPMETTTVHMIVRRAILAVSLALLAQGCAVTYVNYADACATSSQCCAPFKE